LSAGAHSRCVPRACQQPVLLGRLRGWAATWVGCDGIPLAGVRSARGHHRFDCCAGADGPGGDALSPCAAGAATRLNIGRTCKDALPTKSHYTSRSQAQPPPAGYGEAVGGDEVGITSMSSYLLTR